MRPKSGVYGVPQFFQATALLANKRVLEKAGVSSADLDTSKPDQILAAAKKMYAESGGNPSVLGFDPDVPGSANIWFVAFGGQVYNSDGSPTLDNPKNVEALTWLKALLDAQGGYAKVKSFKDTMDVFGDKNQYVADQVGVQTWAQWYPNVLAGTADQVSIEAIPIKDASGQPIAMAAGTAFAIPKAGKNPAAACAWAIKATSTDAWLAAGKARAETVAKNKSIATGLMTGSPDRRAPARPRTGRARSADHAGRGEPLPTGGCPAAVVGQVLPSRSWRGVVGGRGPATPVVSARPGRFTRRTGGAVRP